MFEEFMGIPAHPLLVHAAVVFVPLLALLAIAYAFVPAVRRHTRWVLGLLAVGAPLAALAAKLSGDAFFARMNARDAITEGFYPTIDNHRDLGTLTLYAAVVLGLLTLALVFLVAPAGGTAVVRTGALPIALGVLVAVASAASLYYVIRTGDSGAKAVWTGQ
ncbi:DUF2231 domain-containing protein [Actinomycetes bacterium KLBMP 9797]